LLCLSFSAFDPQETCGEAQRYRFSARWQLGIGLAETKVGPKQRKIATPHAFVRCKSRQPTTLEVWSCASIM
jgi:hypothetical protein